MKDNEEKNLDLDFESTKVPISHRRSFANITIVWLGFVFVITSMITGGGLAEGLDFKNILIVTFLGNTFLSIIAILVSYMASKTGLSFALITVYSFGRRGSKIATLFVPIINIGWYTIQAATYGHFISNILGLNPTLELIVLFISAVVMGIFAFSGMKAITILGYVAIPAIIFLSIGTAIKSQMLGEVGLLKNFVPKGNIDLVHGVTIVIGTWILSTATCIADIMRFAKSTKEAMISSVAGLMFGNSLLLICGAIATIGMGQSDLTQVLLGLGLVIPSFILMTTNIFTTNAANLYSSSLNLANSFKTNRKTIIAIILVFSGVLAMTKPYKIDVLFTFLNALGVIVPPLAGIIIGDFYIVNKRQYPELDSDKIKDYNIAPWISWAVVLVIVKFLEGFSKGGYALNGIFGLPAMNGIIFGLILYPIFNKILNKRRS